MGADFRLGPSRFATEHTPSEFEKTLDHVAKHEPLHTLRMLNDPDITYSSTAPAPGQLRTHIAHHESMLCQIAMQNFANEIMRYMVKVGSSIHLLSSSPGAVPEKRPRQDTNGHRWPVYTYIRRQEMNGAGLEEVVAAPLAHAILEMPDCTVLAHAIYM
ncbi:hypothetical protein CC86DRAFT_388876 [Ophiobolus disseminans]|uniref:Uncharacterized protein n=1 Tax=Ophiobolus disseminans TaxID=1469910 RepID=A0A6A6ZC24_9PLEO|nr:hypothetical protein CC86DRAFT_388876 [Ophiobolus disseminans]